MNLIFLSYGLFIMFIYHTKTLAKENSYKISLKKLQNIIDQKNKDEIVLKSLHDALASTDHKHKKTISEIKRTVEKLIKLSEQPTILSQSFLKELEIYQQNDTDNFNKKVYGNKNIPSTGLLIVDSKIEITFEQALLQNVDFEFEIKDDLSGLGQIIRELEFVNLLGDIFENSFIAIKHLRIDQTNRKIKATLGNIAGTYEVSIADSGIPFNTDILIKLGLERVTSHAEFGGNGYGYETIFEILDKYNASLIITEYQPSSESSFSKSITIRFDEKADFIIKTFRSNILKSANINPHLVIEPYIATLTC